MFIQSYAKKNLPDFFFVLFFFCHLATINNLFGLIVKFCRSQLGPITTSFQNRSLSFLTFYVNNSIAYKNTDTYLFDTFIERNCVNQEKNSGDTGNPCEIPVLTFFLFFLNTTNEHTCTSVPEKVVYPTYYRPSFSLFFSFFFLMKP